MHCCDWPHLICPDNHDYNFHMLAINIDTICYIIVSSLGITIIFLVPAKQSATYASLSQSTVCHALLLLAPHAFRRTLTSLK